MVNTLLNNGIDNDVGNVRVKYKLYIYEYIMKHQIEES